MYAVNVSTPVKRAPLSRARIITAAIRLADREGLESTSMRRLAETLSVSPMALYKHVAHRDELVDGMVDRLLADLPEEPAQGEWRTALRARILATRSALIAHPWARDAIESRTLASPDVLAYMDSLMATMFDGGLSADLVHHAMHALSTRMWGFTRDVMPTPSLPADPAQRAAAMTDYARTYPAIVRMATTAPGAAADCDDDAEFAFALDLLLDGIACRHAAGWRSMSRRKSAEPLS